MPVGAYQTLNIWQRSMALVIEVYRTVATLPRQETYGLAQQLRRAAVSIPANIAEGNARRSKREQLQFVSIALGSLAELETLLLIVQRLGYADPEHVEKCSRVAGDVGRMLRGLESAVARRSTVHGQSS